MIRPAFISFLLLTVGGPLSTPVPAYGEWAATGSMNVGQAGHTATLLPSGDVLIVGEGDVAAEVYDLETGVWKQVGALNQPRFDHAAILLPSGKVLVVGGNLGGSILSSSELYNPATEQWTSTGRLNSARYYHTLTLLPSGKVLTAGGAFSRGSAEIYDPLMGRWQESEPLHDKRERHTATVLLSGKVLVVGGRDRSTGVIFRSAEIYDPASGSWTLTGTLNTGRTRHIAILLPTGKVLVAGGWDADFNYLSSAELYDPETGEWEPTSPLHQPRVHHTATLMPSGNVLVAGGYRPGGVGSLFSVELYDPAKATWQEGDSLLTGRDLHTATLLPPGELLVAGGANGNRLTSAELLLTAKGSWQLTSPLSTSRAWHTATLLLSGEVLLTGGTGERARSLASAELYDPVTRSWKDTGSLAVGRRDHTSTLLQSGEVLVVGGWLHTGNALSSVEIYAPDSGTWDEAEALDNTLQDHSATLLPTGEVLVAGGLAGPSSLPSSNAVLYDPSMGGWKDAASLQVARYDHTATLLATGEVLVAGGDGGSQDLTSAELYDPTTDRWEPTGSMITPRVEHTAVLLPSGKVLVAGGSDGHVLSKSELYDPASGVWMETGSLNTARMSHVAILLPSGNVLVAGGAGGDNTSALTSVEAYNPASGTWRTLEPLNRRRGYFSATLLPSGEVLAAAGLGDFDATAEIFTPNALSEERHPVITFLSKSIRYGSPLLITGERFRETYEASGGNYQSSAVNHPLIHLRDWQGTQSMWLQFELETRAEDGSTTLQVKDLPPLYPGPHLLSVVSAGLASEARRIEVECDLLITKQPSDQVARLDSRATFSIDTQGGRQYQWKKNGVDIAGANETSYVTFPITASDAGTLYSVQVNSGCKTRTSEAAKLIVEDEEPPTARVLTPSGGEYWLLSDPATEPDTQIITWEMADNIRICRVDVSLLFSDDGGVSFQPAPAGSDLPVRFGSNDVCRFPGVSTTSVEYTLPSEPPSGRVGSLYKIQVEAADQAGHIKRVRSHNPFFMVNPNPDSVRTLVLANPSRMKSTMNLSTEQVESLMVKLRELADHPKVQGLIVDLDEVTSLRTLYRAWDANPGSIAKANRVLFADGGLHDHLLNILEAFSGVKHVILVGDDRIIPMARIKDRTTLLLESNYVSDDPVDTGAGLSLTGTTVGRALAKDYYLSDDPLFSLRKIIPADLQAEDALFLPDLAIGRLVETHEEIITAIATFISQDGVLDLTELSSTRGHKILVTGYDFLMDSAKSVRERWKSALDVPEPYDDYTLAPVDGQLIGRDWSESSVDARRAVLLEHFSGNGGKRYGVVNPNGHATHYELGVPGIDRFDIQGLAASSLAELSLSGSVVYAVGCHGGLCVAGSENPADHSLDLPQTMLGRGVQVYLANTGYGWGLVHGVGQSERLVEIFTEELTRGGTIVLGDAYRRTKERYFLESPRIDDYDVKTLMQWAFYGFPMYSLRTGISNDRKTKQDLFQSASRKVMDLPAREEMGAIVAQRRISGGKSALGVRDLELPPFLTRVEQRFDLSGRHIFTKHDASGEVLPSAADCSATDDDETAGCYYTLNGLATGSADLPIEPFFVYDSRLSGTSQHGVLWLGGTWREEKSWVPLIAELASNGGDGSNHGPTPRIVRRPPRGGEERGGRGSTGDKDDCRPSDLDLNSVVVTVGESLKASEDDETFSLHRLDQRVDLEVLYFHNSEDGEGNCDRQGPLFGAGPYHEVRGTTVEWSVPVSDAAGVWRVVAVYTNEKRDEDGIGRWVPVELEDHGDGVWQGRLAVGHEALLTYYMQAVDTRGNVSWLLYEPSEEPASGVAQGIPLPVDVAVVPGTADLAIDIADSPDPVRSGKPLLYTIDVRNLGPDPASSIVVTHTLPEGMSFVLAGGEGWNCQEARGTVSCTRENLDVGAAPEIWVTVLTQAVGNMNSRVIVAAFGKDPVDGNNANLERTQVKP